MMSKKTYTVIPRMEKSLFREEVIPLLVIPCLRDSQGAVGIYAKIGQHGYAAPLYIQDSTRPPKTVAEWRACLDLIEEERTLGPRSEQLEAIIVPYYRRRTSAS